jgi:hypothetical protein
MATTNQWNCPDSLENYKDINSGKPNYTLDEVQYVYNEAGYRCDEFTLESEFPILFMGCSYTEGVGLPPNEVWSHHIHTNIVNATGKTIPYWSLGKGGTSIDYAARCFYEYGPQLKPKYVFYLMSGISRREFCVETSKFQGWVPKSKRNRFTSGLDNSTGNYDFITKLFLDPEFSIQQAQRSAMILNSVATTLNTNIFIFDLNTDISFEGNRKIDLFNKFDNIEYCSIPVFDYRKVSTVFLPNLQVPKHLTDRPDLARDNQHPGAVWQYKMYDFIWSHIKDKISLE